MLHGCAGHEHRVHHRARGDAPCFAHLPVDAANDGDRLFGGIFVGDAPAWGFAGSAQFILKVVMIDAHDHAVGAVAQFGADGFEFFDELPDGIEGVRFLGV